MDFRSALDLSGEAVKLAVREVSPARALVVAPRAALTHSRGVSPPPLEPDPVRPAVGFGAALGRGGEWKVAVRAWAEEDLRSPAVQWLMEQAPNEADVRVTGVIRALAARPQPAPKGRSQRGDYKGLCRPLRAGHSVGHHLVTVGTLGAWVERLNSSSLLMLSNNHVLANVNAAKRGDPILQPGPEDDPQRVGGQVGKLNKFVPLRGHGNVVDAATATVAARFCPDDVRIPEIGTVKGWFKDAASHKDLAGERVQKTGRTTGHRWGTVGAIVNDFAVDYGDDEATPRVLRFDRVLEVHPLGARLFSDGGDSGSLVLDSERYAVGLLFAGNGRTTYMNPIGAVLDKLGVVLVR